MGKLQRAVADGYALRNRRIDDRARADSANKNREFQKAEADYDKLSGMMGQTISAIDSMRGTENGQVPKEFQVQAYTLAQRMDEMAKHLQGPGSSNWTMMVDASLKGPTGSEKARQAGSMAGTQDVAAGQVRSAGTGVPTPYATDGVTVPEVSNYHVNGQETAGTSLDKLNAAQSGANMSAPSPMTMMFDRGAGQQRNVTEEEVRANPSAFGPASETPQSTEQQWFTLTMPNGKKVNRYAHPSEIRSLSDAGYAISKYVEGSGPKSVERFDTKLGHNIYVDEGLANTNTQRYLPTSERTTATTYENYSVNGRTVYMSADKARQMADDGMNVSKGLAPGSKPAFNTETGNFVFASDDEIRSTNGVLVPPQQAGDDAINASIVKLQTIATKLSIPWEKVANNTLSPGEADSFLKEVNNNELNPMLAMLKALSGGGGAANTGGGAANTGGAATRTPEQEARLKKLKGG